MFTAARSTIAKLWKEPQCPSLGIKPQPCPPGHPPESHSNAQFLVLLHLPHSCGHLVLLLAPLTILSWSFCPQRCLFPLLVLMPPVIFPKLRPTSDILFLQHLPEALVSSKIILGRAYQYEVLDLKALGTFSIHLLNFPS